MSVVYVGIDVGSKGAIAAIYPDGSYESIDLPNDVVAQALFVQNYLRTILSMCVGREVFCMVEQVSARPTDSRHNAFTFGEFSGSIRAAVALSGVSATRVVPLAWRNATIGKRARPKEMTQSQRKKACKDESMSRATELFPGHTCTSDGQSDALLIAWYGKHRVYSSGIVDTH